MEKNDDFEIKSKPVCLIVLGMAGSGKVNSNFDKNKLVS
jgi:6-phosphogluconolactonase/glucosamine-6-phosphate isomerase/deaminase